MIEASRAADRTASPAAASQSITVMILTNGDGFQVRPLTTNPVESRRAAPATGVPEKAEQRPANPAPAKAPQRQVRGRARVAHHGGLHARPAARWTQTAQGFSSQAELHFAGQVTGVDSLVGIKGLGSPNRRRWR
ncbi:HPr family phosphocarrier protein [Pseudomonas aeruginosa]